MTFLKVIFLDVEHFSKYLFFNSYLLIHQIGIFLGCGSWAGDVGHPVCPVF